MRTSTKLLVLASTMCIGCGDATGERDAEGVGYVLLDLEARDAGYALDGFSKNDTRLPLELPAGEVIDLLGPKATQELTVAADELLWVRGDDGVIEYRALDVDVARDVVFVVGDEEAAKLIAKEVGGIYEVEEEDLWRVSASDAFENASQAALPPGLEELLPAVAPELADMKPGDGVASAETRRLLLDAVPAKRLLSFEMADALPIHELLSPPVSCDDPVQGIWVSREYYPAHDDWYVFTLEVRRDAEDPSHLLGRIRARTWSGDIAIESPTACDQHPAARWADPFDITVAMEASGTFSDGYASFEGQSWRTASRRCGPQYDWFGYNLDRFSGKVTRDGRWLNGVNNDGGRSVDDPHDFRRISCL